MSATLQLLFDSERQIGVWISFADRPALSGGAGVHRFVMEMHIDGRNTLPACTAVQVTGRCWLVTGGSRAYLGQWTTEKPIALYERPFATDAVLELRDDQLALIEHRRAQADGSVRLELDVDAALTGGLPDQVPEAASRWPRRASRPAPPRGWPVAHGGHTYFFTPSQWTELLGGVNAHTALVVVLPVPVFDPPAHRVGDLLREAVKLATEGQTPQAVVNARRAIEAIDRTLGSSDAQLDEIKAIIVTSARKRTPEQRLALLRYSLYSLASPSAHGDEIADSFTWNREVTVAIIAASTALAATASHLARHP